MKELLEAKSAEVIGSKVSRRSFLKWSSLLAGSAMVAGTSGCALEEKPQDQQASDTPPAEAEGTWISAQCWADCGSRGFNKVYVVDGKPRRMGTDETHEDSPNCPRNRSCARGRAGRSFIFSADRLKYPMKRKHWEPGGGDKSLRGKDEWERITWDEALDLVASEIERITSTYGNEAIVIPAYVASLFGQWDVGRTMSLYGGYMDNWGAASSGAWGSIAAYTGLLEKYNDRMEMRNSELIVLWGANPAWSRAGVPTYNLLQAKRAGARFISIDIFRNATAEGLADEWVPVRPGTDVALAMGMAYYLLKQDEEKGGTLLDWDFLDRCCIGFDAEHLPEGAHPEDNFKDYVLGTFDNVPKDPAWASEICGVPTDVIEKLALEIASTEKVAICMAPAPARTTNGQSWPQTILALGAMCGCIGKPGCMVGSDAGHSWESEADKPLVLGGNVLGDIAWFTPGGREMIENPIGGISPSRFHGAPNGMYTRPLPPYTRINVNELWTSVLERKYTAGKDDIRECKTQMYWHVHSNLMNQAPGTMLAIEAHREVEFVLTQNLHMTTAAKYSDIVLPITTQWEREGDLLGGYRESILLSSRVSEPLFEAKDDIWVAEQLAERLGVDAKKVNPTTYTQEVFNQLAASTVITDDGQNYETLLTITQEDIDEMGVEGEPQEGRIPYKQLREDGIYTVERSENDNFGYVWHQSFREDPEKNPLNTVSGKFEIHSQALAEDLAACGWSEVAPIPHYIPAIEGYEETYSDWEGKVKGEYPFQLVTIHSLRFAHSMYGNVPILRESFDHPFYMNPVDATALGLAAGDTVLVSSKWGKVLRPLVITDVMTPGVTALAQGAWVDIDEETGIDKAGCVNVLVGPNKVAFGHQAYNSCIVKVEKWDGDDLLPDAMWPQREVL